MDREEGFSEARGRTAADGVEAGEPGEPGSVRSMYAKRSIARALVRKEVLAKGWATSRRTA